MRRRWRGLAVLVVLGSVAAVVHGLAASALVDHGVAGALLAGGGGWTTVASAALFLLFRLSCFVALAATPALLVWRGMDRRAMRSGTNGSEIEIHATSSKDGR